MIIGICEDNEAIREELRQEIGKQQTGIMTQLYEFASGEAMLSSDIAFDLVFLDIELNGAMTGLELGQQLQNKLPDLILVFVSGYTQYISSALRLHTFQFLLKPLDKQLFQEEFVRCVNQYRKAHAIFKINQGGEIIEVEIRDIVYIESDKHKLMVHLRSGKVYEMYGKISEQEELLSAYRFARIHKSFLVNCKYIKKFQDEQVQVAYAPKEMVEQLPVSRRFKGQAREQYHQYYMGGK